MTDPILDIKYTVEESGNKIIAEITRPPSGDMYFANIVSQVCASEFAKKYVEEFCEDIKTIIDIDKVKSAIADEIVKLGMDKLKHDRD